MLHGKGWHPTAVFGTLGASMAAAKLLKLDVDRTAMALGIAASTAAGLTQNFGTDTKSMHAGNAARNGIMAALLARDGFTAAPDIMEGHLGFPVAFFHGQHVDVDAMANGLGQPFALVDQGVNVKKYPCCLLPQRAVDAMIELAVKHDLKAGDIAQIDCELPPLAPKILFYEEPANSLEAKFSLQYCLAAALIDRQLGLAQFTDEKVCSQPMRELGRKIRMHVYPDAAAGENGDNRPDIVVVQLNDGTTLTQSVLRARGHAEAPLDWDELVHKFRDAAGRALEDPAVARAIELIERIDTLGDVGELMAGLAVPARDRTTTRSAA
jgi:2-methylcitrate dehydratase PrpD